MMKHRFEHGLDLQLQAVAAVCDPFRGQEAGRAEFTVTRGRLDARERPAFAKDDLGVGNRLTLLDDEILASLKGIQLRNGYNRSAWQSMQPTGKSCCRRRGRAGARYCPPTGPRQSRKPLFAVALQNCFPVSLRLEDQLDHVAHRAVPPG